MIKKIFAKEIMIGPKTQIKFHQIILFIKKNIKLFDLKLNHFY
jgi:hypothetical protein